MSENSPKALYNDFDDVESVAGQIASGRNNFCIDTQQSRGKSSEFKFFTLSELETLPDITWIVSGLIPECGLGQINGESGAGKSFLTIDLGMHISNGWKWCNMEVKKRTVVYCGLEGGFGIKRRIMAYRQWAKQPGNTPSQVLNGEFLTYLGDFDMLDERQVIEFTHAIPDKSVVFIDTQASATPGVDENSSRDMGVLISNAKKIIEQRQCTIIFIHHLGKDVNRGARGWSGQRAAFDFEVLVKGRGMAQKQWLVGKCKDGIEGTSHNFKLEIIHLQNPDGSFMFQNGIAVTSCVAVRCKDDNNARQEERKLSPTLKLAMDTLAESVGKDNKAHVEVWRKAFYQKYVADNPDTKQKAFRRARQELVYRGLICIEDDSIAFATHQ